MTQCSIHPIFLRAAIQLWFACLWTISLIAPGLVQAATDTQLTSEVLALDQAIYLIEQKQVPSNYTELTIFIGSQSPGLRLRSLSLRIDDHPTFRYEYSQAEWESIAAGGLHPALILSIPEGAHRLQFELYARTLDSGPNDARAVERLDRTIEVQRGGVLELSMTQKRFGRTGLQFIEWHGSSSTPPTDFSHPWVRAGQFWIGADRPYAAARMYQRLGIDAKSPPWADEAGPYFSQSLGRLANRSASDDAALIAVQALETALIAAKSDSIQSLEEIGRQDADSEAQWNLRDRANLELGYYHLHRGSGKAALKSLAGVRSPGPYGNQALLGFGWAFLLPDAIEGNPQAILAETPPAEKPTPTFVTIAASRIHSEDEKDRVDALENALVPWTELLGLDPLDGSGQEGALAVAWALDELKTGAQAHIYYERAVTQLELARQQLIAAMEHVASGKAAEAVAAGQNDGKSGWRVWLADLPYVDDTGYLKYLLRETDFIQALDTYRGARLLFDELSACSKRLAPFRNSTESEALSTRLAAALTRSRANELSTRVEMERIALNHLRAYKLRTERYLVKARFAMARHFDSAPEPEFEIIKTGGAS